MNFWFEMAINAVEVTLILSFLVQYFGYRMACPAKYIWTALFGVLSFGSVAFFSWGQLYEGYASSIQILINIAFCCILLRTFLTIICPTVVKSQPFRKSKNPTRAKVPR